MLSLSTRGVVEFCGRKAPSCLRSTTSLPSIEDAQRAHYGRPWALIHNIASTIVGVAACLCLKFLVAIPRYGLHTIHSLCLVRQFTSVGHYYKEYCLPYVLIQCVGVAVPEESANIHEGTGGGSVWKSSTNESTGIVIWKHITKFSRGMMYTHTAVVVPAKHIIAYLNTVWTMYIVLSFCLLFVVPLPSTSLHIN